MPGGLGADAAGGEIGGRRLDVEAGKGDAAEAGAVAQQLAPLAAVQRE
ncbi:hypothetical protein RWA05_30850 (plasmid) [Sinorhizobium meliloti]|nr:hypothetical protein [Sinorhizobium meliloti]